MLGSSIICPFFCEHIEETSLYVLQVAGVGAHGLAKSHGVLTRLARVVDLEALVSGSGYDLLEIVRFSVVRWLKDVELRRTFVIR